MRWWPREPLAGDLVWCCFPQHEKLQPGPKARPALVLKVWSLPVEGFAVQVAYGTSRKVDRLRSGEFRIGPEDGEAYGLSGLSYPTKFDMARTVELPYDDDWFRIPEHAPCGQNPKLGVFHACLMGRLRAARDAAHDE